MVFWEEFFKKSERKTAPETLLFSRVRAHKGLAWLWQKDDGSSTAIICFFIFGLVS